MPTVYRMQSAGIEFSQMKKFNSTNWSTDEQLIGLCATTDPDDLVDLAKHWYHGVYDGQEVVVFNATILEDVGDGFLTEPLYEIERMPLNEFVETYDWPSTTQARSEGPTKGDQDNDM